MCTSTEFGYAVVNFKKVLTPEQFAQFASQMAERNKDGGVVVTNEALDTFKTAVGPGTNAISTFAQKDGTTTRVEQYFALRADGTGCAITTLYVSDLPDWETYRHVLERALDSAILPSTFSEPGHVPSEGGETPPEEEN
jgi:hypothetical protein